MFACTEPIYSVMFYRLPWPDCVSELSGWFFFCLFVDVWRRQTGWLHESAGASLKFAH